MLTKLTRLLAPILVWAISYSVAFSAPLNCDVLKTQIAAQENEAHAQRLAVVRAQDVGPSHVLGSCGGGQMRIVLRSNASTPKNGPLSPGMHLVVGPDTCVNSTTFPVSSPEPRCDGSVTPDDVLSVLGKVPVPISGLADVANKLGYGNQRHQDYAECKLVCASIPAGILIVDNDLQILFKLAATLDPTMGAMAKQDEGRWGPGAEGYWEIDPGFYTKDSGDSQLICKQARNWASSHSREFKLVVRYKVGSSNKQNPDEVDKSVNPCTNGMRAP